MSDGNSEDIGTVRSDGRFIMTILYSIIVVCLNAGERLQETVESITGQKFDNFEVVIKDGGSSDGSIEAIKKRYDADEKFHIYTQKDTGIYDAMNQAVKLAKGAYLLFLNAGDTFYDAYVLDRVTNQMTEWNNQGIKADIMYGNMYHKALNTVIYSYPEINDFMCYRNVPCHQTCFYAREMFETRGYDTAYNVRADYEHFLWCVYEKKAKIVYLPLLIASYEGGGYSETRENKKRSAKQHREIVVRYMGRKKANKYRLIMLLTLAPLRSAIANNKCLSKVYNKVKTAVYKGKKS